MSSTKLSSLNLMFLIVLFCTLVFVIANVALNHWMFLEERKRERLAELEKVAFSLAAQFPYSTFRGIAADKGAWLAPEAVQVAAINEALQPIVDAMALSHTNIKMGFYSLEHSSVVAIAPNFNPALLRPEERFRELEDIQLTGAAVTGLAEWDGKPVMYAVAPIFHQGRIIGFSFADMQTENIRAEAIARTTYISLAAVFLVLSFVATVFAGFEKLKNDLRKFAVSIASGETQSGQTSFPELQPILNLIKGQALTLARLDRLNLMGEIAASIGHEVRNPMTTVRGFLQYLAAKEDLAKYRSQFALMQAELDRANSILTEFLSLAKERTVELKTMNLRAVIEEIVPLLEADALHANCALKLQFDKTPDILLDE
ncbi:MAG: hypothetical protein N2491_11530 [Negativicutes bacterium]|nr:hypothetical protein [Negativicutes bacterium]